MYLFSFILNLKLPITQPVTFFLIFPAHTDLMFQISVVHIFYSFCGLYYTLFLCPIHFEYISYVKSFTLFEARDHEYWFRHSMVPRKGLFFRKCSVHSCLRMCCNDLLNKFYFIFRMNA